MPLPAALTTVPVHGQILKADASGTPASGTVSFRVEQALRDTTDNVLLSPTTLTATLDATGAFTISLPATDDPDVSPSGWTYLVSINTDAWRDQFRISVPAATAGTLELADIAPAVAPSTLVTYVLASTVGQVGGPAGPLDANGLVPTSQVPGASPSSTVVAETSYGQASTAGASALLSRGDHTHGTPSLTSAAPTVSAAGDSAAAGAATTPARADHVHGRESFGSVVALSAFNTTSANGSAATLARSDHVHGAPAMPDQWQPSDHGLIAWACDPTFPNAGSAPTVGVIALSGLMVRHSATVSTIYASVSSAGAALVNCAAGVYDSGGNLLAVTADQSSNWGTGFKAMSVAPFAVTSGLYWVAILVGAGTTSAPSFHRVNNVSSGFANVGLTAATARGASAGSALAALPSTITPASSTLTAFQLWTAIS